MTCLAGHVSLLGQAGRAAHHGLHGPGIVHSQVVSHCVTGHAHAGPKLPCFGLGYLTGLRWTGILTEPEKQC
jgi:hypothetical protein